MLQLHDFQLDVFSFVPVLSALCLFFLYLRRKRNARLPYPPGPKPLPIIGNLRDLPTSNQTATYVKWAKEYGDIVHVNVLGNHMVFLNTVKATKDLFDNRSVNYSDRNHLHMINDLMGWDWSFGMMPYGPRWSNHRKMFYRQFKTTQMPNFMPIQQTKAHSLLPRLREDPANFIEHLRHNAAATIMKIVYGIEIANKVEEDRYVSVAEEALFAMAVAARPGAFLVDMLPFLKHVPAWLPGAGFKRKAAEWKKTTYEMRDGPFEAVKAAMAAGKASPSFVSRLLSDVDSFASESPEVSKAEQIDTIKGCAGLAYAAGAESMVSSLSCWFLAMVIYPGVQKRAQAELDRVLKGRLPTFEDQQDLPYIQAMVTETLRWNGVAPLGLPHMSTKDDVYNGYFIPAGTTVAGNTWAILHDPEAYPQPMEFKPERFMPDPKTGKPSTAPFPESAFGYGRRICPGRNMAHNYLFITMASILACFDLTPREGAPKPTASFTDGMISHPAPFECSIEPRSEKALELIRQAGGL